MSTLLDALANTLSLHKSGSSTRLSESRHKLEHTYLYFQGSPVEINNISSEGIRYSIQGGRSVVHSLEYPCNINSFQLFELESGVYLVDGIPVEITRRLKKIYKKSFSPEAYVIECLDHMELDRFHMKFTWFSLFGMKRQTIYRYKDRIFYGRKAIGEIRPDKTLDISSLFSKEVTDAIRNGTIKI